MRTRRDQPAPVHAVDAEIDEAWRRVIADTAQIRNRTAGELADGAEVALENLEIFRIFLVLAKRSLGPDPLADQARPHFRQHLVHLPAEMRPQIHEEREWLRGKTLPFQERLEQAELERRKASRQRRHADERNGFGRPHQPALQRSTRTLPAPEWLFVAARFDLRPDFGPDIGCDLGPDFRPDFRTDLRTDLGPDLRTDFRLYLWLDLGPDFRPDVGRDFGMDFRLDLRRNLDDRARILLVGTNLGRYLDNCLGTLLGIGSDVGCDFDDLARIFPDVGTNVGRYLDNCLGTFLGIWPERGLPREFRGRDEHRAGPPEQPR